MAVTTTTASELTATQVAAILTRPLEAQSSFLASGPRIYDTAGPLRLPSAPPYGGAALPFTGESELIPEADANFGEVTLMPSTMESVKVITRYSNELARQSVVALESALRDRLVRDVAGKLDTQFYSAGGDGIASPQGMFAWAGVSTVAVAGAITLDWLLTAQATALAQEVDVASLRCFLRPGQFSALRALKDADTRYMLQPDATSGGILTILGMPVTVSSRIPSGYAAVADMSQVAVARDVAPSVTILSERYADYDEQAIRVVARYDTKPVNPKAVVTLTGITPSAEFEPPEDEPVTTARASKSGKSDK
jgi:HK97 family phage major capsid protein